MEPVAGSALAHMDRASGKFQKVSEEVPLQKGGSQRHRSRRKPEYVVESEGIVNDNLQRCATTGFDAAPFDKGASEEFTAACLRACD